MRNVADSDSEVNLMSYILYKTTRRTDVDPEYGRSLQLSKKYVQGEG